MITDKVGGSSAKPEVSKQSKEKRLKHKVSGDQSPGAAFCWEPWVLFSWLSIVNYEKGH